MRDRQTAELAIKLANTGHLTFSTLHTNDAPSAVSRLYKMGVEPFLIAYAINIVVAQRLMRNLCPSCKEEDKEINWELARAVGFEESELANTTVYRANPGTSCNTCKGAGYKGRRAIAETLLFSDDIRRIILRSDDMVDEDAIREQAISEGMLTLQQTATRVVIMGESSIEELVRVTGV